MWNEAQVNAGSSALAAMPADFLTGTEFGSQVSDRPTNFLANIRDPQFKPPSSIFTLFRFPFSNHHSRGWHVPPGGNVKRQPP
jgi:hypothetical protein